MRAHRRKNRRAHVCRRDIDTASVGAIQNEPLDAFRMTGREGDRRAPTRRAAYECRPIDGEPIEERPQATELGVEREIGRFDVSIREPDTEPVIPDERESCRQIPPEPRVPHVARIGLEMTHPPRRGDEKRPVAAHIERYPPACPVEELDSLLKCHRCYLGPRPRDDGSSSPRDSASSSSSRASSARCDFATAASSRSSFAV